LYEILDIVEYKIWNPGKRRQEVFFDRDYNSLIDLYSYGHDIEAAWLINRTTDILGDEAIKSRMDVITRAMADEVYKTAFRSDRLPAEEENGVVKEQYDWWVQAECVNGFLDAYQRDESHREYLEAAEKTWKYIEDKIIDKREGSEWLSYVTEDGTPGKKPIVEPWKCPYHNGRMCIEVIKRGRDLDI
ncbi:MAG: AGE family epimerase/isomerase, partial [Lachnospiraceae bacterium]|nr:AGE family epimerase/isomerase [Lachnospiraceae bacterium]